ncbi:hypothetical protein SCT_2314 [Sulfuricella sp. T08]|uniref:hypothetical protein n=1 Tax=Sulfuricella sp. T08 TaxID=1632857 RepID=UPI00061797EA|nr:hypothetical protein [Sulfuricella sp. T08]GAO36899.1 hypothetical protein SCT_2314 [Sulfuricella sp. T08]
MNSPVLPEPALSPQFSDAITCKQWLKTLPLTNAPLAHAALTAQMELLNRTSFTPLERLKISELLREPIAFVQLEMARKYLGKPLPLEIVQLNNWNSVVGLWAALGAAYRLSLQACLEGDSSVAAHSALITQRCLRYTGLQLLEYYRIYREVDKRLWQQAHELYALAEQRGYAMDAVRDSLNKQTDSATCAASYAQILLTHLADPYRLSSKQLLLVDRWLDKWGGRVTITTTPPKDSSLSLIGVDLASSAPPVVVRDDVKLANPRYLDTERLASSFRRRIKRLRKNEDPFALGLGEDCVQPDCEALLTVLYQHWCEAAPKRRNFTRRPGADKAQVALGMAAIHFFLGGEKPFKQPGETEKLSKREIEDLQFFGRISDQTEKMNISQLGFGLETWQIQDEGALGFRLARSDKGGIRSSLKQPIAIRPADSNTYALGVIKWLIFPSSDGLNIGVRVLPGAPLAIAVRPVSLMTNATSKFVQAFLLPDMPVLKETTSLVLPPGWFAPGRLVEIRTGEESMTVKLNSLIEKGSDYERVGFVRVTPDR